MNKRYIIGLGSGRCGTLSLMELLNLQEGVNISHEKARLPWKKDSFLAGRFFEKLDNRESKIVGDICFSWLPYVKELAEKLHKVRFICLYRNRIQTIDSYLCKCIKLNNWTKIDSKHWAKEDEFNPIWHSMYPEYNLPKRKAIAKFYNDYYKEAIRLEKLLPSFKIFSMNRVLNRGEGQKELFKFLGIEKPVYKIRIKLNSGRRNE